MRARARSANRSGITTLFPSEQRLRGLPWAALAGLAPALDAPLAAVLSGAAAEAVVPRVLRAHRGLDAAARRAVSEALFGVGLWRRRLRAQLGRPDAPPRLLLAALLRDLGGRADAAALAGLEPGALPPAREPPAALADRLSLPDWLAAELVAAAGDDAPALADALGTPGPVCLRVNTLRVDRAALAERLRAEGVATRPGRLAPDALLVDGPRPNVRGLAAWRAGLLEVQDEGSQLVGALVGARPGEVVLDACAGAGGKTLLLAAAVGPAGRVLAWDPDAARLLRLRDRARAAGAAPVVEVLATEPAAPLTVDRILVDAPCSELGPLRRGPDLRWRLDPAAFAPLPALQGAILARAAGRVRPGGLLVYATCTFRRAENEDVARAFEAAHPDFVRAPLGAPAEVTRPDGFVQTLPHRHGADGFFAAGWRRT